MAWWEYAIFGYVALVLAIGVPYIINCWRRPTCPRCFYPLFKCECEGGADAENVERTVRRVEGRL